MMEKISIMSILIVLVLLYITFLIIKSFKKKYKGEKNDSIVDKHQMENKTENEKIIISKKGVTFEELESDQDMLMAAMIASIEACGENKEINYKIVSIKQL